MEMSNETKQKNLSRRNIQFSPPDITDAEINEVVDA